MVNTVDPEKPETTLEQRARDVFAQQTASLDAHTLSRLNQARQSALDVLRKESTAAVPRWLMPASSVAAMALLATMVFHFAGNTGGAAPALSPMEDMEIMASSDEIDLLQDVDFYDSLDNVVASENGTG